MTDDDPLQETIDGERNATLGEATPDVCDHCGRPPKGDDHDLERVGGHVLCPVHASGYRDGRLTDAEIEEGGSA